MSARGSEWLALLCLATAVAGVYLPALRSGFIYDDHEVIEIQPRPAGAADLLRVFAEPHFRGLPYYRPVVRASLLAQKALHGDRPAPFHLANALLAGSAAAAALVLLRAPALGIARGPAWLAAALFAVHPVASSAVYPIASGRETLLPALLILVTVAAWLRGRRALSFAALAAALLAKEQAVVAPLLLVLADACGIARGAPPPAAAAARAWVARHAPSAALLLLYFALRRAVLGPTDYELAVLSDPIGPLWSLLFGAQVAIAPFAALRYEPELAAWLSPPRLVIAAIVAVALAWLARTAGAPSRRVTLFWVGWFVATQLATANLLRQEARFDERYAFLALLSFPAVAAASASALPARAQRACLLALAAIAAALAAATMLRAPTFRDDAAFAAQWLRSDPGAAEPHHMLALLAARDGRIDAAVTHYEDALRAAPSSPDLLVNLAVALAQLGREAEARQRLAAALRLDPGHPEAHTVLGALLARAGRLDEAVAHHRESVRASPRLAAARMNLGVALARQGRFEEAEAELREALRLDPGSAEARRNLASALRAQGKSVEAELESRSAR
jgi:Flp pilus assembly protein TadD